MYNQNQQATQHRNKKNNKNLTLSDPSHFL